MKPLPSASFVVRPRPGLYLALAVLALTAVGGCGHRRSAMRPVYVTPAPVAAPCPSTAAPATVAPAPATGEPALSAPVTEETTIPMVQPSSPAASSPPQPTSPPSKSSSGEPGLQLAPNDPSSSPPQLQGPSDGAQVPNANAPTSLRSGRRIAPTRVRQASLRERLRPYVTDPDDLFSPPKADRPWKYIVLHHSAKETGSYDEIDREHRKVLGWDGCGYHFVIGNGNGSPDGQIEVARRWSEQKQGVHCRNGKTPDVNEYGVGICLVGNLDKSPPTPKQIAAAKALVAYLSDRYQIPRANVETHAHLAASPTACPGRHFPAQAIFGSSNLARR